VDEAGHDRYVGGSRQQAAGLHGVGAGASQVEVGGAVGRVQVASLMWTTSRIAVSNTWPTSPPPAARSPSTRRPGHHGRRRVMLELPKRAGRSPAVWTSVLRFEGPDGR
jgi:hypothetical protein